MFVLMFDHTFSTVSRFVDDVHEDIPGMHVLGPLILIAISVLAITQLERLFWRTLDERSIRQNRDRCQIVERAAIQNRERSARDTQILVARKLAAVVTLTEGAMATMATDPESATDALNQVAKTGREALAEVRRFVGTSTNEGAE